MHALSMLQGGTRAARLRSLALLGGSFGLLVLGSTHTAQAQLVITPTFASSITSDPNSAAIQGVINSAISVYQSKFSDPINVTIQFGEMTSGLGQSNTTLYKLSYGTVYNALVADKTSADDNTAVSHLPNTTNNPVNNTSTINIKTATIRALGISGSFPPTASSGFDGVIGLNTTITDIGSPGTTGQYSLIATVEHEIDEVLGLGSDVGVSGSFFTDPAVEDLYRYTAAGARSFSLATDDAYLSLDGTTDLARYNNLNNGGDTGDYHTGGTPQVQDAFATPGATPTLNVEFRALDAIGYTLKPAAATPEPSTYAFLGAGALALSGGLLRRRRARKNAA